MELTTQDCFMILNGLPGIGPVTVKRLLTYFRGDIRAVFAASIDDLVSSKAVDKALLDAILKHDSYFNLEKERRNLSNLGGKFLQRDHMHFPSLLKEIPDPPIGIYMIGDVDPVCKNIAIVGSRNNTLYGLKTARQLAIDLANRGFTIVSGMARGIDTAAHEGALAVGGKTIAVLGCGVDVVYPPENGVVYRKICENGAVISEYPLGRRADKQTFPVRNRLIAGLCHAVIVVESDKMGGSMITARFASEYGRQVFAVPGRIDQPSSAGCLALIKDGATMLTSIDDVFEDLPYLDNHPEEVNLFPVRSKDYKEEKAIASISCPIEKRIYDILLKEKSADVDLIVRSSQLPIRKILYSLQMMEIRRLISRRYDGRYEINEKK